MEQVQVNQYGMNQAIRAHLLDEVEMRRIGFSDHTKRTWYYNRVVYRQSGKYGEVEITFNVTIPKSDVSQLRIDVLDEDFLQPYDYQAILALNPQHEIARQVKKNVEKQMAYLQEQGVLSGHIEGAYI